MIVECRQVHLLLPRKRFVLIVMQRIFGLVKPWSLSSISLSVAFARRALFFRSRPRVLSFDWYEDDQVLGWEHTLGHDLPHAGNTSSVTLQHCLVFVHHITHPHNWREVPLRASVAASAHQQPSSYSNSGLLGLQSFHPWFALSLREWISRYSHVV